jgi:hypothetical protein
MGKKKKTRLGVARDWGWGEELAKWINLAGRV